MTMIRAFLEAADAWVCDRYWMDVRYLAERSAGAATIWQASIVLSPVRLTKIESNFEVSSARLLAGQQQRVVRDRKELASVLREAVEGRIGVHEHQLRLQVADHNSEMTYRDRWYAELHLAMDAARGVPPLVEDLSRVDDELRAQGVPFDGLADLCGWLGLPPPGSNATPRIQLKVSPPCDLAAGSLSENRLKLTLRAHEDLDTRQIQVAVRAAPGRGLASRSQAGDRLRWGMAPKNGERKGSASIKLENADQVLVMLMIGGTTVRRQWFVDANKARNSRLLAIRNFDKDLRMLRNAVFDTTDPSRFERGVATLAFLLGFAPGLALESDSPDMVIATPGGHIVIVECTTRIADFAQKLAAATGRHMARVSRAVVHPTKKFAGVPCPFLVDDACSVYEARPYACRAHVTFDESSYWCAPERAYAGEIGQLELGGAKRAYAELAARTPMRGFADIRDFFPSV